MSDTKTGGYAFPTHTVSGNGMTLRDYFAAHANVDWNLAHAWAEKIYGEGCTHEQIVKTRVAISLAYADVMLKERSL